MKTGSRFTFTNEDAHHLVTGSWVQGAGPAPHTRRRGVYVGRAGLDLHLFLSDINPPPLGETDRCSPMFRYSYFIKENEKGRWEGRQ